MPVVTCPKCPTKLKIPDGVSGNTKCPKCNTVFPVKQQPAFEVVEDAPAPSQKPGTGTRPATQPAQKPAQKPATKAEEPDFEVVDDDDDDRPRKKKKSSDDEDDDDGKTKVVVVFVNGDDDDDDDEPRRKKKGKKRKKKRYDDDDDDDWYPQGGGGGGPFAKGKTGALLMSISFWLNMGAFGVLTLYVLIAWLGFNGSSGSSGTSSPRSRGGGDGDGSFLDIIVILPGLVGLGAWIVGTIGCAFAIAGPTKARGMAITSTVFAGVHLLLTGVTFSNMQEGLGSVGRSLPGVGKVAWIFVASTLPWSNSFLPLLFYQSRVINGEYVITLLAAICEALRLVFMLMTLKALSEAAKDYGAAEKAHFSLMTALMILGGVLLGTLLMVVLLAEGGFKSGSTYLNLGMGTIFLMYLAYTFMMLGPALAAIQTKDACYRRS